MGRHKNPEADIQCAIVQHLRLRGVPGLVWWHTPNGGKRGISEASMFKAMGVRAGVSDLILVHANKIFALELKAPGGRATEAQMAFISDIDRAGAFTALVEGLDPAIRTLEAWGLLRGETMRDVLRITAERLEAS